MRLRAEVVAGGLMLASCATVPRDEGPSEASPRYEPRHESRAVGVDTPVKIGRPYTVNGVSYVPFDDRSLDEVGAASWYGQELAGARTANGEIFDPQAMTAAHRTLPLPSYVEVTALDTGRIALVRVNDRGPFTRDRIIDLSLGAARALGVTGRGSTRVRVRRVEPSEAERQALRAGRAAVLPQAQPNESLRAPVPRDPDTRSTGFGNWYVQVASFASEERADRLAATLDGVVTPAPGGFRVRLGPYRSDDAARAALESLARNGYPDAIVTR